MLTRLCLVSVAVIALGGVGASAQTTGPGQGPAVERVVSGFPGGTGRNEGVRVVAPGALMLASLDEDHNGKITDPEISAGAAALFQRADKNGDKSLTAFEQGDWANVMGSGSDVLANPMLFDADLDRSVTEAEFRSGLLRLAASLREPGETEVSFAELVRPLNARPRDEGDETPDGVDRVEGPPGSAPRSPPRR